MGPWCPNGPASLGSQVSFNLPIDKLLFKFSLSVYPPGPPEPQIAIRAASPPQMVDQDDIAVIEVEQSSAQDDSIIEQAEASI